MSYYWIKLYHEIIDDPKMATLPDNLWRRVIELFLLAGRHNQDGQLPDSKCIAWELRMSQDDTEAELQALAKVGIVSRNDTGWFVNQFASRQAARGDVERQRDHRDATKRNQYNNAGVTDASRSVTQNRIDIESDTDKNRIEVDDDELTTGNYAPLAKALRDSTKLPDFMPTPIKYTDALKTMFDAGVLPADIISAVDILHGRNYQIVGASSVVNTAISEMGKRKAGNNGHRPNKNDQATDDYFKGVLAKLEAEEAEK